VVSSTSLAAERCETTPAPAGAPDTRGRERFCRPWLRWELDVVSDNVALPLVSVRGGLKPLMAAKPGAAGRSPPSYLLSPLQRGVAILEVPTPADEVGEEGSVHPHHLPS
jgi:hypothetical protein